MRKLVGRGFWRILAVTCLVVSSCHAVPGNRDLAHAAMGHGGSPSELSGEQPVFVFAAIGDPHITVASTPEYRYIKATDKSPQLLATYVRDINAHVPRVDFAVLLGDVTDRGSKAQFDIARKIVDSLKCQLYPVVGNHDNFESDAKAGWKNFARRDSTDYTFDMHGFHFVVIDCTTNPYGRSLMPNERGEATSGSLEYVECGSSLRDWVAGDLARNRDKHVILLTHYNMWKRPWGPQFDTTASYAEYNGMKELRAVLEQAGNVVAVINGHVHANRMEVHNGIYYIDVGATLVGRPSIRYFSVYPDRIEVSYAYISDQALLDYVVKVSEHCTGCSDPKKAADFADGSVSDKQFTIHLK